MRIILALFMLTSISLAAPDFNETEFVIDTVTQDLEYFSQSFYNKKIKITEASTRISLNPLQWLLMLKDLAASEKRKVMVFRYKEEGAPNLKKGYTVMTYSKVNTIGDEDEVCYLVSLNKLEMDISWVNLTGILPGLKSLRTIERCVGETYSF